MMRAATATVLLAALLVPKAARGADDLAVWNDFSRAFREGHITAERIRPYLEQFREPLLRGIATIRAQSMPEDWERRPEIHRVGDQIHFLIPLTTEGNKKTTYCFTVVTEGEAWFFQHMEAIFIRLDQTGPLPVSRFPDVTNDQKNWMREEIAMTERVRLFNLLAKEKSLSPSSGSRMGRVISWRPAPGYPLSLPREHSSCMHAGSSPTCGATLSP